MASLIGHSWGGLQSALATLSSAASSRTISKSGWLSGGLSSAPVPVKIRVASRPVPEQQAPPQSTSSRSPVAHPNATAGNASSNLGTSSRPPPRHVDLERPIPRQQVRLGVQHQRQPQEVPSRSGVAAADMFSEAFRMNPSRPSSNTGMFGGAVVAGPLDPVANPFADFAALRSADTPTESNAPAPVTSPRAASSGGGGGGGSGGGGGGGGGSSASGGGGGAVHIPAEFRARSRGHLLDALCGMASGTYDAASECVGSGSPLRETRAVSVSVSVSAAASTKPPQAPAAVSRRVQQPVRAVPRADLEKFHSALESAHTLVRGRVLGAGVGCAGWCSRPGCSARVCFVCCACVRACVCVRVLWR